MSDDIRHGVVVFPLVAGWDAEAVVPMAQIAIAADAIPGDVAAALWSTHSDEWCIRLIDELLEMMEAAKDAERHDRIAAVILAGAGALE